MNIVELLTVGQAADEVSLAAGFPIPSWRIARVYELKLLPEPPKFGGKRAIPRSDIPLIVGILRSRGVIPTEEPANV